MYRATYPLYGVIWNSFDALKMLYALARSFIPSSSLFKNYYYFKFLIYFFGCARLLFTLFLVVASRGYCML